jgi:hypothetical protein
MASLGFGTAFIGFAIQQLVVDEVGEEAIEGAPDADHRRRGVIRRPGRERLAHHACIELANLELLHGGVGAVQLTGDPCGDAHEVVAVGVDRVLRALGGLQAGQEILDATDEQLVRGGHARTLLVLLHIGDYAANHGATSREWSVCARVRREQGATS